ncbi:beta-ketoacyl synthase N-terminal-like domain-containing protein [Streptomyces monomycini]|uniref:beta-ketoacyl synthase N-terminal-like domain-containing protein n=1 Tax=Streptomyces monomycini TaxID=371720 RepID=UPI0007C5282C|nr:type I polyketide synthase [Streptomyces monomycini]
MDPAQIRALMEDQLKLSRQLRARISALEEERHAPVAVVGMGLRLPSGRADGDLDSPAAYWDFLKSEGTALSGLPEERPGLRAVYDPTPGRPGRSYVARAGFLSDIAGFDAEFFGISTREARLLDPQQRLLLETSWEALERAGIAVRRSDRLNVGVYLGMMASEYTERMEDRADTTRIDPYYTTGGGLCFGAGRIAFVMGFSGPVVSMDTACSSSLSALHLAVRGLRAGECRYALACGSNLLLSANLMVSLCQTRALSPEGRSKSFLASADGYGRGEGVGAIALMRLDDALRERRPVLAVIRGTAVNHDGAASALTAPNGSAQQEVIRAALEDARTGPGELGWVEAHGTGTVLGDPIEIGALAGVLGEAVRERGVPLGLGSVKSRLGHLEAASGIAAVIKTVLMLHHGEIPAARDASDGELNPHIPWQDLPLRVPSRGAPWPAELPRRVAGVNSFGMSGTNVHVVIEAHDRRAADEAGPAVPPGGGAELLTVSARDERALTVLAERLRNRLRHTPEAELPSLCHTLRSGRVAFARRLAVVGTSAAELAGALERAERAVPEPVGAGDTIRSVTVRVADDAEGLARALTALTAAFPQLADGAEQTAAERAAAERATDAPAALLCRLLALLGLRGSPAPGLPAAGALASVHWDAEGAASYPLLGSDAAEVPTRFLQALSALFTAGADLRFDALAGPSARLLGDLPTYPFQHRRYWVDEPPTGVRGEAPGDGSTGSPDSTGSRGSRAGLPEPHDRAAVHTYLQTLLTDVLQSPDPSDTGTSFLDAGGDSFTATVFISQVEENYRVGLSPADLPLDLPLAELCGRLADDIAASADDIAATADVTAATADGPVQVIGA